METYFVCETCHSDNIRSRCDGVAYCEDCDAPCTVIEIQEDEYENYME